MATDAVEVRILAEEDATVAAFGDPQSKVQPSFWERHGALLLLD